MRKQKEVVTPPLSKKRKSVLFGAPIQGETIQGFEDRMVEQAKEVGMFHRDGSANTAYWEKIASLTDAEIDGETGASRVKGHESRDRLSIEPPPLFLM